MQNTSGSPAFAVWVEAIENEHARMNTFQLFYFSITACRLDKITSDFRCHPTTALLHGCKSTAVGQCYQLSKDRKAEQITDKNLLWKSRPNTNTEITEINRNTPCRSTAVFISFHCSCKCFTPVLYLDLAQ